MAPLPPETSTYPLLLVLETFHWNLVPGDDWLPNKLRVIEELGQIAEGADVAKLTAIILAVPEAEVRVTVIPEISFA